MVSATADFDNFNASSFVGYYRESIVQKSTGWKAVPNGSYTVTGADEIHVNYYPVSSTLQVNPNHVDTRNSEWSAHWTPAWTGVASSDISKGVYTYGIETPVNDPTRVGYKFTGWESNTLAGSMPSLPNSGKYIFGATAGAVDTLTATWKANEDTKYVVKHYFQDLNYNKEKYTLRDAENFEGKTDDWLTLSELSNSYDHFTYKEGKVGDTVVDKTQILPDGSLEINLYYTRDKYKIETSSEGSGSIDDTITGIFYEDTKTISYEPKDGYYLQYLVVDDTKIAGKDLNVYLKSYKFANIDKDHEIKAVFKAIPKITVTTEMASRLKNVDVPWNMISVVKITGTDYLGNHYTYYRSIEGAGSVKLQVPAGTYTVSQLGVDRWKQTGVTGVTHCTVSGTNGVCDTSDYDAHVKFINDIVDWSEYSDNDVDVQ